jgi:hypothetical protein
MKKGIDFWVSMISNTIWVFLGLLCFFSALGYVGEILTWWLFGVGLVLGGGMGIFLTARAYNNSTM